MDRSRTGRKTTGSGTVTSGTSGSPGCRTSWPRLVPRGRPEALLRAAPPSPVLRCPVPVSSGPASAVSMASRIAASSVASPVAAEHIPRFLRRTPLPPERHGRRQRTLPAVRHGRRSRSRAPVRRARRWRESDSPGSRPDAVPLDRRFDQGGGLEGAGRPRRRSGLRFGSGPPVRFARRRISRATRPAAQTEPASAPGAGGCGCG